jgi:hypothetical protein
MIRKNPSGCCKTWYRVWQNPNLEETQRFRRCYGEDHWRRVTEWFLQARAELNDNPH